MNELKTKAILLFFLILSINLSAAYAESLQLFTDNKVYSDGQPLLVYGKALPNDGLILRLFAPDGTIAKFDQIAADGKGEFLHVLINWPNPSTTFPYGTYTVEVISNKEIGFSQKVDVKFAPSSELVEVPIQRTVNTLVFAPLTAAVNTPIRIFVQTTSDGALVAGSPEKLLGTSHVHLPTGEVTSLALSFKTLHQGIYYADYTPTQEGTYVFHIVSFNQGTVSNGSATTVVLKQDIEGISNQILQLNSILQSTSEELDKLKNETKEFGSTLEKSQVSLIETNKNIDNSVKLISGSVKNIEEASGQFNSLFLPIVALIAVIIALQITILARRR
ncbi:MAG TPA: methyl-accepting chemotaxis protein [Nitrosopumilaceae archaeon]|nr:methyl-accepting chemotaxis protein [Nitrosopumilaceae archaeon]